MSSDAIPYAGDTSLRAQDTMTRRRARGRSRTRQGLDRALARPELLGLLGLAAGLNLWGLGINGYTNQYYSAAVRSMTLSWHNFLFASLDQSGLMTVDKPPLSLWVQALSARVFGFHPLSMLIPQALMGVVAVGLVYDLVRRRFGRVAGFAGGLALATTPIVVAVSRHNNPDELLVLCSVAALWFAFRALETGRTRWLVLSGIAVGLGFETKMLVAMMVVPGIAAAWIWCAPAARGRLVAMRQLLAGGAAMLAVALAWPLVVMLTPAADRPWISGTSDNSIWSLIFGYNGVGRVAGQTGGPGGGAGPGGAGGNALFGGSTGPFRLLQSGLGDQAGWLLGFAAAAGLALLVLTRVRRRDPRTGWLMITGGAFITTAVVFSFAQGIFHPYYVSLLAPFSAALLGAGAGLVLERGREARVIGPLMVGAGIATELVVLGGLNGSLSWATPLVIGVAGAGALLLALELGPRVRLLVLAVALAALFAAPAAWAFQTIGHATNGTFPAGGPTAAGFGGGPGFGGRGQGVGGRGQGVGGPPAGFGAARAGATGRAGASAQRLAGPPGGFAPPGAGTGGLGSARGGFPGGATAGSFGGDDSTLTAAIRYAKAHGGGTIGVSSQSSAASAILGSNGNVAGLGGFSGRESSVSASWLAGEVKAGRLRWVLADQGQGARLPGDTRTGSQTAISIVEQTCRAVTSSGTGSGTSSGTGSGTSSATGSGTSSATGSNRVTMYDCAGRASAILAAAANTAS